MPRLRRISRKDVGDPVIEYIFTHRFGSSDPADERTRTGSGARGDWESVLAGSPDCFEHAMLGLALWDDPAHGVDPLTREIVKTRVGWLMQSRYVYSERCKALRGLGASQTLIDAVRAWEVADVFSPAQRAALAYTDCLVEGLGRVPDKTFADLQSHFSDKEVLTLSYMAGMYVLVARISRAFRLEFDDRDDPIVEAPAPSDFSWEAFSEPMDLPRRPRPRTT